MNFKSKKITFIIPSLAGGGAEGVCVNIANGLAERHWKVTLVVLNMNESVYHEMLSEKVKLVVLNINNARYSFKALYRYIKNNSVKKIVVFNYELAAVLNLIRILTMLNFYLIARNINSITEVVKNGNCGFTSKLRIWLTLKLYKKSDHIVNQCEGMKSDLLSIFPNIEHKCSTIYNPVNKKIEDYAKSTEFDAVEKLDYVLCTGRLENQKAFHYAIEAFAEIAERYPRLRLKIVGQGSLEAKLRELTVNLQVAEKVDFEGFQKNIIPYYIHAKATLLTSLYEGFPNVLIESITLGTPVVAFDCKSGPKEIIKPLRNGILIENKNVKEFGKAIDSIVSGKKLMTGKSINRTAKKFNHLSVVLQWESLIGMTKVDSH